MMMCGLWFGSRYRVRDGQWMRPIRWIGAAREPNQQNTHTRFRALHGALWGPGWGCFSGSELSAYRLTPPVERRPVPSGRASWGESGLASRDRERRDTDLVRIIFTHYENDCRPTIGAASLSRARMSAASCVLSHPHAQRPARALRSSAALVRLRPLRRPHAVALHCHVHRRLVDLQKGVERRQLR